MAPVRMLKKIRVNARSASTRSAEKETFEKPPGDSPTTRIDAARAAAARQMPITFRGLLCAIRKHLFGAADAISPPGLLRCPGSPVQGRAPPELRLAAA